MYDFTYMRPTSVHEAVDTLRTAHEPRLIAGGMTLLPAMKARLSAPGTLIDLSAVGDLRGIETEKDILRMGAMTRHCDVASSETVLKMIPGLSILAGGIADWQVRYRGTIGGSLSNSDPAADYPAAMFALSATMITDRRKIRAIDFFQGLFSTALEDDEVLCKIELSIPQKSAYVKIRHPASGYAMTGVFAAQHTSGYKVAVTGAAADYFHYTALEAVLDAGASLDACRAIDPPDQDYMDDIHASAAYRKNLVRVASLRAVEAIRSEVV